MARAMEQVLAIVPDHPRALNSLGNFALNNGDVGTARAMLERAVATEPARPEIWFNLSAVYRAGHNPAAELQALERCLALDPYFAMALLSKAILLERQGNLKAASRDYQNVLTIIGPNPVNNPGMAQALAHGREVVAANSRALEAHLEARLAAVRRDHASADFSRANECLNIKLGRQKLFVQEPTFLAFPALPAICFYDRTLFPWLDTVEAATDAIRDELKQALAADTGEFVPYVAHPNGAPLNQWAELNHSPRWSAYHLLQLGKPVEAHKSLCPQTMAALAEVGQPQVPGNAPNAFFSQLAPQTRIPAHTGMTNTRLTVHLALTVPDGCGYRVGGDVRQWQEGKAWVFDDTVEHEAWNNSDDPRVVLIFDVWNPFLTAAEKAMVSAMIDGMNGYYEGG